MKDHSNNGRVPLGGRPRANMPRCWETPCPHVGERAEIEQEFLNDYWPWNLDDAAWLGLNGFTFRYEP